MFSIRVFKFIKFFFTVSFEKFAFLAMKIKMVESTRKNSSLTKTRG